jgi:transcriptional antiterminator RfaH
MSTTVHWFCLQAQPKREHIAADHLRQQADVEVFLPRIRFQKRTVRGLVWFTEALFPGYLFARFDFQRQARQVRHTSGVRGVVHFGDRWPSIPDEVVAELREAVGTEQLRTISDPLGVGEEVEVGTGAFCGMKAVVSRVMPAHQRVRVLLEFLGRQTCVEVKVADLIREGDQRLRVFPAS